MILCSVIKYAVQNKKFMVITEANGEHCSKRNATAQHQNKGFYSEYYWLSRLTHIIQA